MYGWPPERPDANWREFHFLRKLSYFFPHWQALELIELSPHNPSLFPRLTPADRHLPHCPYFPSESLRNIWQHLFPRKWWYCIMEVTGSCVCLFLPTFHFNHLFISAQNFLPVFLNILKSCTFPIRTPAGISFIIIFYSLHYIMHAPSLLLVSKRKLNSKPNKYTNKPKAHSCT